MLIKNIDNLINNNNISEIFKYSFDNCYNHNGEKYIGEMKDGLKDGKGIFPIIKMIVMAEKYMKLILKMIKGNEKVLCILIMEKVMKEM